MGREAPLQKTCRRIAEDRGAFGFKLNPTNGAGLPDYPFCYRGLFCTWEFKSAGGKTDPGRARLQEHYREQLRQAGARVAVIETPDEARAFLDAIDDGMATANL